MLVMGAQNEALSTSRQLAEDGLSTHGNCGTIRPPLGASSKGGTGAVNAVSASVRRIHHATEEQHRVRGNVADEEDERPVDAHGLPTDQRRPRLEGHGGGRGRLGPM